MDERTAPLAGLVAAFVFAVQMLNFPVGVGTSGHLLGGALAAVLVGPYTATLVISVVLIVQCLLFADGGLTALGTNITLMGVVGVWTAWWVTKAVLAVLPNRPASVVPASFVAALVSVPAAALAFTALYVIGGDVDLALGALLASMVGWHSVIGVGEAVITGFTVRAVVSVRPDLVYAARGLQPVLQIRTVDGVTEVPAGSGRQPVPARSTGPFLVAGLVTALLLAGVVSFFASSHPDGLEYVAGERGFLDTARDHLVGTSPLADYGGVGDIPVGLAGILGVLVTVGVGIIVFRAVGPRDKYPRADRHVSTDGTRPRHHA